jgi:hypothetical protein
MREMTGHPVAAVALLRHKLRPVRSAEPAQLNALLARLDAEKFEEREKAFEELVELADAAEPRLRLALGEGLGLEVKRRVERALERIELDRLRAERAVEVLEIIGNDEARKVLRELAGGMRGATRTEHAAGAMERATRRGA